MGQPNFWECGVLVWKFGLVYVGGEVTSFGLAYFYGPGGVHLCLCG